MRHRTEPLCRHELELAGLARCESRTGVGRVTTVDNYSSLLLMGALQERYTRLGRMTLGSASHAENSHSDVGYIGVSPHASRLISQGSMVRCAATLLVQGRNPIGHGTTFRGRVDTVGLRLDSPDEAASRSSFLWGDSACSGSSPALFRASVRGLIAGAWGALVFTVCSR